MKHKALLSASLAALMAVTATAGFPQSSLPLNSLRASAVDDGNDDWLHAVGSRLYDMNGNEVWLTGANWFGMNCTENVPHGLYARDVDDMLSSIADHGINIIRFPISTELLLSWMDGEPLPVSSVQASYNPPKDEIGEDGTVTPAGKYGDINRDFVLEDGKTMKDSMQIFDIIMQKCKKYGIKALIDVHSPASHNSGHNYSLWYYEETADDCDGMATGHFSKKQITWDDWKDSITWLAKKYANDDTILAYDLKNEPHGKRLYDGNKCPAAMAKWDDSTDKNNWKYSAEECAKSILKVNPHALILVEGIEQSPILEKGVTWDMPDKFQPQPGEEQWYGAWWGGNLRGVKNLPVLPDSGQIVYSPHDYGPSVYAQSWFDKDFSTETLLDDYWRDTWAYINEENIAPLLIGEWGGHMDKGPNQKWMELLRDYMIKHHINHTFWCLNPNSGDTGGLLDTQFAEWDAAKYGLFEESLWQTKSGKYIGLDHQTALGKNGMSLNEFYSGPSKSEGSNLDGGSTSDGKTVDATQTKPTASDTTQTTTTTTSATTSETTSTTASSSQTTVTTSQTTVSSSQTTESTSKSLSSEQKNDKTVWGDANEDGTVDVSDAVLVARFVAEDAAANLNAQGKLNANVAGGTAVNADCTLKILRYIAKLITAEELAPPQNSQSAPKDFFEVSLFLERDDKDKMTEPISVPVSKIIVNGEAYAIGENSGKTYSRQVISSRNVPEADGKLFKDEALETKLYSGDRLLTVNVPKNQDHLQNKQTLDILIFTDVKDKNGKSYSWDKKEDVELISMAFKALNPAVPADANILNRLDSNEFPANCYANLEFQLESANPQTGEITRYEKASFYWNADTGSIRCESVSPEETFGTSSTIEMQVEGASVGTEITNRTISQNK